jgi:hypothetical protein
VIPAQISPIKWGGPRSAIFRFMSFQLQPLWG